MRDRVLNLVRQSGLSRADEAALLESIAAEIRRAPRLTVVGSGRARSSAQQGRPNTLRKRRSRAMQNAGLRAIRGTLYANDNTLASLVRLGVIPQETAESDLELLDAISAVLDRLAW
ncbi:hypothetical protein [Woeseia oceani]|uniref:Uncharacterized protein n=1 Tax=Woeseia oceani TaxID=1548547 RepID=A0A193LE93_9GAMM|nr:hypothetical protein [Woeseia oceani]ANO50850.1 hypothetical protein BA177_06185 [Woeseia oceani]